jgi:hypothetical protein
MLLENFVRANERAGALSPASGLSLNGTARDRRFCYIALISVIFSIHLEIAA